MLYAENPAVLTGKTTILRQLPGFECKLKQSEETGIRTILKSSDATTLQEISDVEIKRQR